MRALLGSEDFRARWSARDAAGVGFQAIADVVSPVVVVGQDEVDGRGQNLLGLRHATAAGVLGRVQLQTVLNAGVWVCAVRAWGFAGSANVLLDLTVPSTAGARASQMTLGPSVPYLEVAEFDSAFPFTLGALLPPDEWLTFAPPGLLLVPPGAAAAFPDGSALRFACDTNGEDFSVAAIFRSA